MILIYSYEIISLIHFESLLGVSAPTFAPIFEKYLAEQNIKATSRMLDELYKITRGYYLYTEITSLILNKKELSVNDYLVAYTNSGLSFDKFLAKAFISMQSNDALKILQMLAITR